MENVTIKNVDINLLRKQRDTLLSIRPAYKRVLALIDLNAIEGVINLLDEILDNSSGNINTEQKFNKHFERVEPKDIVTFIDLFRKGKLYTMHVNDRSWVLVKPDLNNSLLAMINSGNYVFGTKKPKENVEKEKSSHELIEDVFISICNVWDKEPETLIDLGITDDVYQSFEKYIDKQ